MHSRKHKEYTNESLHKEREHGIFWYNWLWSIVRPFLIGVCVILIIAGLITSTVGKINDSFFAPIDVNDETQILFAIKSGSSLTRVSNSLKEKQLIHNSSVFKYYADFLGYGQKIRAGDYILKRSMGLREILDTLTTGDGKPIVRTITIVPGWTLQDIANYLVDMRAITTSDIFMNAVQNTNDFVGYYYIDDVLGLPDINMRKYALEGYLAANTYEVYTDASVRDIIKKLVSQTGVLLTDVYFEQARALGMTMDEILIMASMIEKESVNEDFHKVSAVFHNRLHQNMPLGSDVTIKYISGIERMSLTDQDLQVNSPYNTYLHRGLPPGPVCAPSPDAIYAALFPDQSFMEQGNTYLYFCSKDPRTTELHFSKTYEEHQQAVALYRPLWQAYDEENKDK